MGAAAFARNVRPVQSVVAATPKAGSPGAILAIGLGAFLVAIAYTGRLQEVWAAAFGGGSGSGYNKDVYSPDPDNPGSVKPDPKKQAYYLIGSCADKCSDGYTNWRILNGTKVIGNYCVDSATSPNGVGILAAGEKAQKCSSITGGGEAYQSVTMGPTGRFRTALSPSTSWSPADVF